MSKNNDSIIQNINKAVLIARDMDEEINSILHDLDSLTARVEKIDALHMLLMSLLDPRPKHTGTASDVDDIPF